MVEHPHLEKYLPEGADEKLRKYAIRIHELGLDAKDDKANGHLKGLIFSSLYRDIGLNAPFDMPVTSLENLIKPDEKQFYFQSNGITEYSKSMFTVLKELFNYIIDKVDEEAIGEDDWTAKINENTDLIIFWYLSGLSDDEECIEFIESLGTKPISKSDE